MSTRHVLISVLLGLLIAATTGKVVAQQSANASATATSQQYSILIWESPEQLARRSDASRSGAYWSAFAQFGDALKEAGVLRGGTALRTGGAVRTVTVRGGSLRVAPTAHVVSRNELGGYFVIEVSSLDEAIRWAARVPSAFTGAVEVRPAYPAPTLMK